MKSLVAVAIVAVASLVSSRPFVMDKNNEALHPARNIDWHPHHHHSNGTTPPYGGGYGGGYGGYQKAKRNWHHHSNGSYPHGGY